MGSEDEGWQWKRLPVPVPTAAWVTESENVEAGSEVQSKRYAVHAVHDVRAFFFLGTGLAGDGG